MVKTKKKLALATQTVRSLETRDLRDVQGGYRPPRDSQCSYDYSGCINRPDPA